MDSYRGAARQLSRAVESYLGRFLVSIALIFLVMILFSASSNGPDGWSSADWEAAATVVTAMVAMVAVCVAVVQLQDARDLRWEQAQPYVAAYLEPDPTDPMLIYLVIENFGSTAAHDLSVHIEPSPQRSEDVGGGALLYPSSMPSLVPAQEWRTFWDFSVCRAEQPELPTRHVVTLRYRDSRSKSMENTAVLDWGPFTTGRRWIGRSSIHTIGERMKSVDKHLARIAQVSDQALLRFGSERDSGALSDPVQLHEQDSDSVAPTN